MVVIIKNIIDIIRYYLDIVLWEYLQTMTIIMLCKMYILFQSTNSIQNNIRTFSKLLNNKFLTAENYNIPLKISE